MKIAFVYDRINKFGGAERILISLHKLFPNAPFYTLVYNTNRTQWAKGFTVITSFMQKLPFAKRFHEYYPILPIFAVEQFDFREFDAVISITTTEAKGLITHPHTLHISYILTPTRYLWSHNSVYFSNRLLKTIASPFIMGLRIWDYISAQRPDHIVTISKTSKFRIAKYYRREAEIIYPPVDLIKFKIRKQNVRISSQKNDYLLVVSRLVKYKRIDIVIEACNALKLPLKIVGEGMERINLEKKAGHTVEFVGYLTDTNLITYYQNCRGLLFPQEEDFGLTAIEALACGKPVVAYRSGGALEYIIEHKNGELFYPQTTAALIKVLEKFFRRSYSEHFCRKSVEKFSTNNFMSNFSSYVNEKWSEFSRGFIS